MRVLSSLVVALCLMTFGSCGSGSKKSSDPSEQGLLELSYTVIDPSSSFAKTSEGIRGSGALIFNDPLPAIDSNQHFVVTFKLDDDGYIDLKTFATKDLKGSISLRIERPKGVQSPKVEIGVDEAGIKDDVSAGFAALASRIDGSVTLRLDVHNSEQGGHVLAWIAEPNDPVNEDNQSFNDLVGGNGIGAFWGIVAKNAEISYVEIRKAAEDDD